MAAPSMPTPRPLTVLVVGATGSIGSLVVEEAATAGLVARALVRDSAKARRLLPEETQVVVGDVTRPDTLQPAVEDVDAVVLTLGSDGGGAAGAETVDYAGVRNVLAAVGGRPVRIALMTAIGVTDRVGAYNQSTQAHDWKRRSERLVRACGHPYTIVRPGWFDYNAPDEHRLVFLQGDTRHAGNSSDGVIARRQITQVLVGALTLPEAAGKTFELVAERAPRSPTWHRCSPPSTATHPGRWMQSEISRTCPSAMSRHGSSTTSNGSAASAGRALVPVRVSVGRWQRAPHLGWRGRRRPRRGSVDGG